MTPQSDFRRISQILLVVCSAMFAWLATIVIIDVRTVRSTGVLAVSATEPSAAITVSQVGHSAAKVGTGNAKVRLAPGDYLLAANGAGLSTEKTVHVSLHKTTTIKLNLNDGTAGLPSVEDVGFVNMDQLIDAGLSTSQIAKAKTQFFTFDKDAKVVSLDPSSVQPGFHDPNTYNPFTINFNVTIDDKPYKATVAYQGFDSAQLTLMDAQTGQPLYSGPVLSQ